MAATPKNGTFTFVGASGRTYNVDAYVSDVAAGKVTFNPNGPAGSASLTFYKIPENCTLVDFSMTTGTADTTNVTLQADDNTVPGAILRYIPHVSTNSQRPALRIRFQKGENFGATQAA